MNTLEGWEQGAGYLWSKLRGTGVLFSSDEEGDLSPPSQSPSPSWEDEDYLTMDSATEGQLPCSDCLEADADTILLPQFCSSAICPEHSSAIGGHGSDSEWEDLEEPMDMNASDLRWVLPSLGGGGVGSILWV